MEKMGEGRDGTVQMPCMGEMNHGNAEWIMEQVAEEISQEPVNATPYIPVLRALTQGKSRMIRSILETRGIRIKEVRKCHLPDGPAGTVGMDQGHRGIPD